MGAALPFCALRDYHFVSDGDGALYDTRAPDWTTGRPLRAPYAVHSTTINTVGELKACLRAGALTPWGGYPLYFLTDDGVALSFKTVRAEFKAICWSILNGDSGGWRVVACDINWEDSFLYDAHTDERIPSAYGEES